MWLVIVTLIAVAGVVLGIVNFSWPECKVSIPLSISIQIALLSLFIIVGGILLAGLGLSRLQLIEDKAVHKAQETAKQETERMVIEASRKRGGKRTPTPPTKKEEE